MATSNVSGFGTVMTIIASNTFPFGFNVTEFADDSDPVDIQDLEIANSAMGLNGDKIDWNTPNIIEINISVFPNTLSDNLLSILLESNRVSKGKIGANDVINMTIVYPDGSIQNYSNGNITNGMPGNAISSDGRLKSKTYSFKFGSKDI